MNRLIIKDRVYGKEEIDSPVLIELINLKEIQRLKKINQFGVPDAFYHFKNFSRFEHSLGVMILLRRLGADEEEQIAGLLHDASHTAFSHVIDWVRKSGYMENAQDKHHKDFILKSKISLILKKHNYSPVRIANYKNFKLLERRSPLLCADRIDYGLREIPDKDAKKCYSGLTVKKDKIVFNDRNKALLFAKHFLKLQKNHWGGEETVWRYTIFSKALRKALTLKIIKDEDFWLDDQTVVGKLKKAEDEEVVKLLKILTKRSLKDFPKSRKFRRKKFRYSDPAVLFNGKVKRLSDLNEEFKRELEKEKNDNKKGVRLIKV